MRNLFFFTLLLLSVVSFSQTKMPSLGSIDWRAQNIEAATTEVLAKKLTEIYSTDLEKVRSIYSWIASHIAYNTGIFSRNFSKSKKFAPEWEDTTLIWKPADEMVADRVLKRRVAVCDGYARLFKTLCQMAGIDCKVVNGYVRTEGIAKEKFRTNHTWNVVKVDSAWQLVDVTWGSGYINYANEFVQRMDDYYFLTSPEYFIRDHYPEEPQWALLPASHPFPEFKKAPYRCKAFVKYGINNFFPANGIIEAAIGDTIQIELQLADIKKAKNIAPTEPDTVIVLSPLSCAIIQPEKETGNRVLYKYVVTSPEISLLKIEYNNDMVLQYRVKIKMYEEDDRSSYTSLVAGWKRITRQQTETFTNKTVAVSSEQPGLLLNRIPGVHSPN